MGKDIIQKHKYIAMVAAQYSQMHAKQQVKLYSDDLVYECNGVIASDGFCPSKLE